ncbi:hypothetical protein AGABI1DRAFT_116574 [Agaricus bisporus var. burnettii JB137-S8]|uniref:Uncharacterized protein n=1 Tax=Agaricus bisporus var. burnettii (strain JB137-S8 / ATCC MYA-4627 / FGSC 10392) TaxID=597362 RepID=K5WIJ3_AGABU|nr:uncharacterized protein AGABI1DRAFT_116574 [Agaricus bisporus var. burnettii JB137-S8]EKM75071.1 hypothetical protein AGABI1DRAFT_116574 [Agaricus bisporus var. burnettii JB137-S8]
MLFYGGIPCNVMQGANGNQRICEIKFFSPCFISVKSSILAISKVSTCPPEGNETCERLSRYRRVLKP